VACGINVGLQTRIYFADESDANAEDPVLASIEPRARVDTLLAQPDAEGAFRFDIHLQGERETVFFDI
jgi:protocatechuate 3,4-dioxygenase alpha subunit